MEIFTRYVKTRGLCSCAGSTCMRGVFAKIRYVCMLLQVADIMVHRLMTGGRLPQKLLSVGDCVLKHLSLTVEVVYIDLVRDFGQKVSCVRLCG
jgi:hypothetical protein